MPLQIAWYLRALALNGALYSGYTIAQALLLLSNITYEKTYVIVRSSATARIAKTATVVQIANFPKGIHHDWTYLLAHTAITVTIPIIYAPANTSAKSCIATETTARKSILIACFFAFMIFLLLLFVITIVPCKIHILGNFALIVAPSLINLLALKPWYAYIIHYLT